MRFIAIAVCSVVLFFPTYWLFNSVVGPNWGAGIAAVAMYIAFPVLAMSIWSHEDEAEESFMTALADGSLMSSDYDISEAVQIEDLEDGGLNFLLDVGDGRTLFLSGQYLFGPFDTGQFPSTAIRVFWGKEHGLTYGVQALGERLLPTRTLPAPTAELIESGVFPGDRDIVAQDIDSVVQLLTNGA